MIVREEKYMRITKGDIVNAYIVAGILMITQLLYNNEMLLNREITPFSNSLFTRSIATSTFKVSKYTDSDGDTKITIGVKDKEYVLVSTNSALFKKDEYSNVRAVNKNVQNSISYVDLKKFAKDLNGISGLKLKYEPVNKRIIALDYTYDDDRALLSSTTRDMYYYDKVGHVSLKDKDDAARQVTFNYILPSNLSKSGTVFTVENSTYLPAGSDVSVEEYKKEGDKYINFRDIKSKIIGNIKPEYSKDYINSKQYIIDTDKELEGVITLHFTEDNYTDWQIERIRLILEQRLNMHIPYANQLSSITRNELNLADLLISFDKHK
ncbi:hypothetical protein D3C81_07550 [compost metagenome]